MYSGRVARGAWRKRHRVVNQGFSQHRYWVCQVHHGRAPEMMTLAGSQTIACVIFSSKICLTMVRVVYSAADTTQVGMMILRVIINKAAGVKAETHVAITTTATATTGAAATTTTEATATTAIAAAVTGASTIVVTYATSSTTVILDINIGLQIKIIPPPPTQHHQYFKHGRLAPSHHCLFGNNSDRRMPFERHEFYLPRRVFRQPSNTSPRSIFNGYLLGAEGS